MRLVLGLLVLLFAAAPASAQSSFASACTASASEGAGALPPGLASRICGCTETAALAAGETAASLARYQAFAATLDSDAAGMAEVEAPPEWAVVTSANLMESMGGCLTSLREDLASAPSAPASAAGAPGAPRTVGVTAEVEGGGQTLTGAAEAVLLPAPAPAAPALPSGLRTGDGGGPVQAVQQGNGAAVRILG